MIVYTRGRVPNANQDYRATEESEYTRLPMVVLINRNSASASEIVTRRAAGSRPRARRRRDDVRQGARAVGLHDRIADAGRRAGADDRALLHAERPHDSAAVGRRVRRVPDLLAARPDGRRGARAAELYIHRRRPQGLQRRRHRARQVLRSGRWKASTRRGSAARCGARQAFANFADQFTAEGDTRHERGEPQTRSALARGFAVTDAMVAEFKASLQSRRRSSRRGGLPRTTDFIRAMIALRDRRRPLRHRGSAAAT